MSIEPFPGKLTTRRVSIPYITKNGNRAKIRSKSIVLTKQQKAWLCRWFPEVENNVLIQASGISHSTLHRFARELGLSKSEQGLHNIMKRQAILCKQANEANGYYDSLRGRPVSEACRKGVSRMWQEIREGKREHPAIALRRNDPERYRASLQHRSQSRKDLIRSEMLRLKYGLPRRTKLRCVVDNKYTRRQVLHRCNALKRGYIIMEDCTEHSGERYNIYYDQNTHRMPIFERNLLKDGFSLLPWKF